MSGLGRERATGRTVGAMVRQGKEYSVPVDETIRISGHVTKMAPSTWHGQNTNRDVLGQDNLSTAVRIRQDAKELEKNIRYKANSTQVDTTQKIQSKAQDVEYWKYELNKAIQDMRDETDKLCAQKKRLQNSLMATEIPSLIANESVRLRLRRLLPDLVSDNVEDNLDKEVNLIKKVQDLLERTIDNATEQITSNREAKNALEEDWSDKYEAYNLDVYAGNLHNRNTDITYRPGAVGHPEGQSLPEDWAETCGNNLGAAERERQVSAQLRQLIDNILQDITTDLQNQSDEVENEFRRRIDEVEESKRIMNNQQNAEMVLEINSMEKAVDDLQNTLQSLEAPMKVVQTRLANRHQRPRIENSRDSPHYRLVEEANELGQNADRLLAKIADAENSLKSVRDMRATLDRDITVKNNSLWVDANKCLPMRSRYPPPQRLQGYD